MIFIALSCTSGVVHTTSATSEQGIQVVLFGCLANEFEGLGTYIILVIYVYRYMNYMICTLGSDMSLCTCVCIICRCGCPSIKPNP